ncbi:MAG: flagellar biosynthesis protein FlhB, partial [Planctomycetes bacterium]|nr:flagellar biosynthesis protein FlhB [Planctomycetota bacterium]
MADNDDKTEDATPKKKEESRQKGQTGKSQDLNGAIIMALTFLFLYQYGYQIVNLHFTAAQHTMGNFANIDINNENIISQVRAAFTYVLGVMAPFLIVVFVAALIANISQIGILITFKTMEPDFNKINPIKGLQQKFSLRTVVMALMNITKTSIIAWVVYKVLSVRWAEILRMTSQDASQNIHLYGKIFFEMAFYLILAMLILALIDFAYQKWQNLQSIKMSKQEVRDEFKNYEGDPKIKQKRRQIQLQMSRQRMMKDVQDADVVITNPTHFSIALKYDDATMRAPMVVAKGADLIALNIREIAKEHKVPIVENKPLARALYNSVEVGDPVPQKLFKAVAEILAYVYNLKPVEAGLDSPPAVGRVDDDNGPDQKSATTPVEESRQRILLAEDVEENQFLLKAYLNNTPYQLHIANNGAEACEMFQQGG